MTQTNSSDRFSTAKVRMSDSAVLAGAVSLLYALAILLWPRSFPELLCTLFESGSLFPLLGLLLVGINELLFVRICSRRAEKPNWFTPVYIAFLTIGVAVGFWQLVAFAGLENQISHLYFTRGRDRISSEELLVYTHLAMVSGIFIPYVVVRVTQNYYSHATSQTREPQARQAAAAQ